MLRWLTALLLWLTVAGHATAGGGVAPIPPLNNRVTDLTGTLTMSQRAQLESRLAALERDKGAQIAILLLPTTQPESIEEYGIRLAEAWKVGRKGIDDGVIVIVAKNDRAVRIEVGYGLEGAIPDALAKRIIEERIAPRFRQGDFFGGLLDGCEALAQLISGEPLPAPARSQSEQQLHLELNPLLFVVILASGLLRRLLGLLGSLIAAALAGYLAYWMVGSWFAAFIAASLAFAFSFARMGRGGAWHVGGGGGGFSGGGGGFSGGGGGFGGGGASGRW